MVDAMAMAMENSNGAQSNLAVQTGIIMGHLSWQSLSSQSGSSPLHRGKYILNWPLVLCLLIKSYLKNSSLKDFKIQFLERE